MTLGSIPVGLSKHPQIRTQEVRKEADDQQKPRPVMNDSCSPKSTEELDYTGRPASFSKLERKAGQHQQDKQQRQQPVLHPLSRLESHEAFTGHRIFEQSL